MRIFMKIKVFTLLSMFICSNLYGESFLDPSSLGRFSLSLNGVSSYLDGAGRTQSLNCGGKFTVPQNGHFFSTIETTLTEFDRSFGVWHHCRSIGNNSKNWGASGDIPVVGDYDGNSYSDYAVFRPSNQTWYIAYVSSGTVTGVTDTIQFGSIGDIPYPIDVDGDGSVNIGVYRRDKASGGSKFIYRTSSAEIEEISFGLLGDQPIHGVKSDLGRSLFGLFRPETGEWFIRGIDTTISSFQFGLPGDIAMGAPILSGSQYTPILYRPKEAMWYIKDGASASSVNYGSLGAKPSSESLGLGDIAPIQSDLDGDFLSDLVLVRRRGEASNAEFISLRSSALSTTFKNPILPAGESYINTDFDGDLKADFGSVRSDAGSLSWYLHLSGAQSPVPRITLLKYGLSGDKIVPADYDGDKRTDLSVVRSVPSENGVNLLLWLPLASGNIAIEPYHWGFADDTILIGDVDGDGRADSTVVRAVPQGLLWLSRSADGLALEPYLYGLESDIPHLYDLNGDGIVEAVVERDISGFKYYYSREVSKVNPAFQWGLEGDLAFSGFRRGILKQSLGVWRIISGQGYFFIRNAPLPAISVPFGVPGDIPLVETVISSAPSSNSSSTTTNSESTISTDSNAIQRISCNGTSNIENQESGFVWKPISEGDGKLVVLFGSSRSGKIGSATMVESGSAGDTVLETLKFVGNTNGNRPTFRAKRSGGSYPSSLILVRQDTSGFKECIKVSNPSKRVG